MKKLSSSTDGVVLGIGAMMLLGAFGCRAGEENLPPLVQAGGQVLWAGKPLGGALVTFLPTGNTRGPVAEGRTDLQGQYQLTTPHGQGAVPGTYRVSIQKWVMPDGSDYLPEAGVGPEDSPARQILPPRYSDFQQTILTATIPPEGSTRLDFTLAP